MAKVGVYMEGIGTLILNLDIADSVSTKESLLDPTERLPLSERTFISRSPPSARYVP